MTITNNHALRHLRSFREHGVPVIFYCQTAAALAPWLRDEGAAAVIAESFPNYLMARTVDVQVWR